MIVGPYHPQPWTLPPLEWHDKAGLDEIAKKALDERRAWRKYMRDLERWLVWLPCRTYVAMHGGETTQPPKWSDYWPTNTTEANK